MEKKLDYTIKSFFDVTDGDFIEMDSADFFSNKDSLYLGDTNLFVLRKKLEKQEKTFLCGSCKKELRIIGGIGHKMQTLHFRHFQHEGEGCDYKEGVKLSKDVVLRIKYNGSKESKTHERLKYFVAERLKNMESPRLGDENVFVEKVYRDQRVSKEWRKPDVFAEFPDKKIAFELQLSTTFLSVITEREVFYRKQGIFILWIFDSFSDDSQKQLFAQKDILVSNVYNVFVLDKEAIALSEKENNLYLKCYYVDFWEENGKIRDDRMKSELVLLSALHFRQSDYKVYLVDAEENRIKLERKLQAELKEKQKIPYFQPQSPSNIYKIQIDRIISLLENENSQAYERINSLPSDAQSGLLKSMKCLVNKISNREFSPQEKNRDIATFILEQKTDLFLNVDDIGRLERVVEYFRKLDQAYLRKSFEIKIDNNPKEIQSQSLWDYYLKLPSSQTQLFIDVLKENFEKALFSSNIEDLNKVQVFVHLFNSDFNWVNLSSIFTKNNNLIRFVDKSCYREYHQKNIFFDVVYIIMRSGYQINNDEGKLIYNNLQQKIGEAKDGANESSKNTVVNYSLLEFYNRIQNTPTLIESQKQEYYLLLHDNWRFITRILSVLVNVVLNCDLPNMSSLANDVKHRHLEYSHLFIMAAESEKGKLNNFKSKKKGDHISIWKEEIMLNPNYKENKNLDGFLSIIFPKVYSL